LWLGRGQRLSPRVRFSLESRRLRAGVSHVQTSFLNPSLPYFTTSFRLLLQRTSLPLGVWSLVTSFPFFFLRFFFLRSFSFMASFAECIPWLAEFFHGRSPGTGYKSAPFDTHRFLRPSLNSPFSDALVPSCQKRFLPQSARLYILLKAVRTRVPPAVSNLPLLPFSSLTLPAGYLSFLYFSSQSFFFSPGVCPEERVFFLAASS